MLVVTTRSDELAARPEDRGDEPVKATGASGSDEELRRWLRSRSRCSPDGRGRARAAAADVDAPTRSPRVDSDSPSSVAYVGDPGRPGTARRPRGVSRPSSRSAGLAVGGGQRDDPRRARRPDRCDDDITITDTERDAVIQGSNLAALLDVPDAKPIAYDSPTSSWSPRPSARRVPDGRAGHRVDLNPRFGVAGPAQKTIVDGQSSLAGGSRRRQLTVERPVDRRTSRMPASSSWSARRGDGDACASGCPWDAPQTHAVAACPYLVEETYEIVEAVETDDRTAFREELGDLLLQVVFHAESPPRTRRRLRPRRRRRPDIADKLMRRHPHVFAAKAPADLHGVLGTAQGDGEGPDVGPWTGSRSGLSALSPGEQDHRPVPIAPGAARPAHRGARRHPLGADEIGDLARSWAPGLRHRCRAGAARRRRASGGRRPIR